jgi:hypothetical protein
MNSQKTMILAGIAFFLLPVLFTLHGYSQEAVHLQLPRLSMSDLVYEGAFRIPANPGGSSSMNYSAGPLAYNPADNSMFYIGHVYELEIIEFPVPSLSKNTTPGSLNMAGAPLQPFTSILNRPTGGAPRNELDMISGMAVIGNEILVNAMVYYDAGGTCDVSTLIIRNRAGIGTSVVNGYYRFANAPVAHHAGWVSPIPPEWRSTLGGNYITGNASGWPIISRLSVGPSAFVFDSSAIIGNSAVLNPVPVTTLLNFDLDNPLATDLDNDSRNNTL